ncbi:Sodium/hydrogen exchanger family [Musa troglodytarum]|uniref:Sodium/hydrogen exchanger family n=1 Tax=Musa troglodytarum TaxID=320322 RepID=A0A9E7KUE6_9LILI|nr:Sodium/hydrogen exchanger family [Musa troglodytarum]
MNAKGSVEMIILNIGKQKILDERTYTMMVLGSILTTAVVGPVLEIFNKTSRSRAAYKRRNLQQCRPDSELRMVACVYTARNVPSIISLLQMSNPTKRSPVFVYVVHLLELTGRGAAMMIVQQASSKHSLEKVGSKSSGGALQADQIIAPFQSYEQQAGGVSVQRVTAVSPYSTMHEDIFNIAEERHTTIIVLPFHRLQSVAGDFEEADPAIRSVNMNVLAHSPCTVCILVDRGISGVLAQHHVAVLFFGGPDDREALTYSSRMAEHPGVILTVIRFLPGEEAMVPPSLAPSCASGERAATTAVAEANMERQLDEECTNLFRLRHVTNDSVTYTELVINNIEETVAAVRAMNGVHSMYVVGRGKGMESSPLLAGLTLWSEYPELGPIGDMLVSADFGTQASVLVVQQYVSGEAVVAMDSTAAQESEKPDPVQRYLSSANHKAGPGRLSDVWMPGV